MARMKKRRSMKSRVRHDSRKSSSGGNHIQLPQGISFFSADPGGRCKLDVLPYEVTESHHPDDIEIGELWYKRPYRQHRNVGINNDTEICPRSIGKPCPICEHRESLLSSKDPDQDVINALKAQYRILYNVRPLSGADKGKILVWDISYHNFQKQLDAEINDPENEEYASFADLEGGYSLKLRFSEEVFAKTKYAKTERIDFIPRDDMDESILEQTIDLDKVLNVKSYKDLQKKFFGLDDDEESESTPPAVEGEEERKPKTTRAKTTTTDTPDAAETEATSPSAAEIGKMNRKQLKKVIKDLNLTEIDPEDYDDAKELQEAIIIELYGGQDATEEASSVDENDEVKEPSASTPDGKCPHGHKWGEADQHDECDECDLWDDCIEAS